MAGFVRVQPWHDTAAGWLAADPILRLGEIGVESDTGKTKRGNGSSKWSQLGYTLGETAADAAVASLVGTDSATRAALDSRFTHHDVIAVGASIDATGATDSTAALQAKINACPDGGTLLLPNGTYKLTAPLVITKHMTLRGMSLSMTGKPIGSGGALNNPAAPYFAGAVLMQTVAGQDGIQISGSAVSVNLHDFGILFSGAGVQHTNTGHGINASPTLVKDDGHDTGVQNFEWRNVAVYGHDGNHYAVRMLNPILGRVDHVYGFGGGGLWCHSDANVSYGNYGNIVFTDTYFWLKNAGTAHGYSLGCPRQGSMNLVTFIRPQCNITDAANTQGTQALWTHTDSAALPTAVGIYDPDLEAWGSTCPINFGGHDGHATVYSGLMSASPVGGYKAGDAQPGYQRFDTSGTFTMPATATAVRVRCVGGGGGGGGGGSAIKGGTGVNQAGGGGGGAGQIIEATLTSLVPGTSYPVTVGVGGTGGAGALADNKAGSNGTAGSASTFGANLVSAQPGGRGQAAAANNATGVGGGITGYDWYTTTLLYTPGIGGSSQSGGDGNIAFVLPPGTVGGGGGGAANATKGGQGGRASTSWPRANGAATGGTAGGSATENGADGVNATTPGCGGGGGGGGAPAGTNGGAGGKGGNGAAGLVEVWW